MPVSDPLVMPLARMLLDCYEVELAKVGVPPRYVGLRTGSVVDHLLSTSEDECCEGLGWVRPSGFFPSSSVFPALDESPLPKGVTAWAVTLELGAIRCAPTPDKNHIPTAEEWDVVTQAVMDDAAAMRRAICCLADQIGDKKILPGSWTPLLTQGGCVGGIMPVTVRGPACDCSSAGDSPS